MPQDIPSAPIRLTSSSPPRSAEMESPLTQSREPIPKPREQHDSGVIANPIETANPPSAWQRNSRWPDRNIQFRTKSTAWRARPNRARPNNKTWSRECITAKSQSERPYVGSLDRGASVNATGYSVRSHPFNVVVSPPQRRNGVAADPIERADSETKRAARQRSHC